MIYKKNQEKLKAQKEGYLRNLHLKYRTHETVIKTMSTSLKNGKQQLKEFQGFWEPMQAKRAAIRASRSKYPPGGYLDDDEYWDPWLGGL